MKREVWQYAGDYASDFRGDNHAHATVTENLRLYGRVRREQGWFDRALLPLVEDVQLPPLLDKKSESRWIKAWSPRKDAPKLSRSLFERTCYARRKAGFRR